jgi:hypothetical protein
VHPDDALEILLSEEIDNAIRDKETRRLNDLQGTSGFPLILDDYISETAPVWAKENPANLIDFAATLADVSLNDQTVKNRIWQTIRSQIPRIDKSIVPTDQTASGLQALVSHTALASQGETAGELVRVLSIERSSLPDESGDSGRIWYSLFVTVANSLPSDLPDTARNKIFSAIPIQANIAYLFAIAVAAVDSGKIPFNAFKPRDSKDEVATNLVNLINTESPPSELDPILLAFISNPACVAWPPVVTAIQTRLQTPDPPLSSADAYRLLALLDFMAGQEKLSIKSVPDAIKAISDDGSLHAILGMAKRDKHQKLVALVVHQLMAHRTGTLEGPSDHPQYGALAEANGFLSELQSSPSDDTLIDNLTERAVKAHRFSQILTSGLPKDGNLELYRAILRRMVELGTYTKLRPTDVITKTARIGEILEPNLTKKLLQRFDNWEITDDIRENKWAEIDPEFLVLSGSLGTKHYKTTFDAISNGLSAFTKDQWIASLKEENNALHLCFTLIDLAENLEFEANFYDALTSHTQTLIDGGDLPKRFVTGWVKLPTALSSARRKQFYIWLRNRLLDKAPPPELLRRLLDLFGTDFSNNADFPARVEDVVRVFLDPILAEGTSESVECIQTHADAFAGTIKSANDADRQLISSRFKLLHEAGTDDEKTSIDFLANTLGILIEQPKSPDKSDQNSSEPLTASDSSESKDE